MSLSRTIPTLAAALALAGVTTPAYALKNRASAASGSGQPSPVVAHHSTADGAWLIGIGAAGTVALLGVGLAPTVRSTVVRHQLRRS